MRYTDPTGDTIRVDEQFRQQFVNSLVDVFGEQGSDSFGFDDRGNLTFSGNRDGLSKEQKKALKGLQKTMESKDVTNVVFGKSYDNNDANVHVSESDMYKNGGALTLFTQSENYIVIDPNVPSVLETMIVRDDFYLCDGKPSNASPNQVLFYKSHFKTNLTDLLFHEIGHILYDGKPQSFVIDYNNHIRKILGLPDRKYDEKHNRLNK